MQLLHFSGIAGAGMNTLAQLMRLRGHAVQGSDRSFDQGAQSALRDRLLALGIDLVPQDGSGIHPGISRLIYSTAVEAQSSELSAAARLGIACVPRPALLAELVDAGQPGVAIAGTSGKSTVTGMVGWLLHQLARPATVLGGAGWMGAQAGGAFLPGPADGPVIAEACESDGTLIGYHPGIGVVHTVSRDHGELDQVLAQFTAFARQSRRLLANGACAPAVALAAAHGNALVYGRAGGDLQGLEGAVVLEPIAVGPDHAHGIIAQRGGAAATLVVPQPGLHTLDNAAAAIAIGGELGLPLAGMVAALATFPGVARRFQIIGRTASGIRVVDDFAHNGEKIRAAVSAAQAGSERLIAIFQPHGFGPARFLREELRQLLPSLLRPQDRFCYSEIYYAGGTVQRDISSRDLADDVGCAYAGDHQALLGWVSEAAMPGDTVLLMGARDPRLGALARAIHDLL